MTPAMLYVFAAQGTALLVQAVDGEKNKEYFKEKLVPGWTHLLFHMMGNKN